MAARSSMGEEESEALTDKFFSREGHQVLVDGLYTYKETFKRFADYLVQRAKAEEAFSKALSKLNLPTKDMEMESVRACAESIRTMDKKTAESHMATAQRLRKLSKAVIQYKDEMAVNRKKNVANLQILQDRYDSKLRSVDEKKAVYYKACEVLEKARTGQGGTTQAKSEADKQLVVYRGAVKSHAKAFEDYETNIGILLDDLIHIQSKAIDYQKESCFEMLLSLNDRMTLEQECYFDVNEACTRIDKHADITVWSETHAARIQRMAPLQFEPYNNGSLGGQHAVIEDEDDEVDGGGPSRNAEIMAFDPMAVFPPVDPTQSKTLPAEIAADETIKLTEEEREAWLARLWCLPGNRTCADCGSREPTWGSINLGILFCIDCSGTHRSMGTHISKVRSFRLDNMTSKICLAMEGVGNTKANKIFEFEIPDDVKKITSATNRGARDKFIRLKYEKRAFFPENPIEIANGLIQASPSSSKRASARAAPAANTATAAPPANTSSSPGSPPMSPLSEGGGVQAFNVIMTVEAIEDFTGEEEGDLTFKEGDKIDVLEMDDDEGAAWWLGRLQRNGEEGLFPSTFVSQV